MTYTVPDVGALAKKAAGNWKRFDCFAWHRSHELADADQWTIVYTSNRDSGLIEQSNAEFIQKELLPFTKGRNPDVVVESHYHWAVGHVDGFSIRVYCRGKITKAFEKWCELKAQMDDCPLLDEGDYSARLYEASVENIKCESRSVASGHDIELPAGFEYRVYEWLAHHDDEALDDCDDHGAYPSEDSILSAFKGLGWLKESHDLRGVAAN